MVTQREELNGWPEGLSAAPPDFPRLAPNASDRERVNAYGSALLYVAQIHPKIVQALEFLYGAVMGVKGQLGVTMTHEGRIIALERKTSSDPPPAEESPSSIFMRESGRKELENKLKAEAARTPGPPTQLNSSVERIAAIADEVLTKKMAEREEQIRIRADRDRLAAIDAERADAAKKAKELIEESEKAKRKFKRKLTYGAVGAFVLALAAAAGTATWVKASAFAEGHQAGLSEAKKAQAGKP